MNENFWGETHEDNLDDKLRVGSKYPPVKVYLSIIDIAKVNTQDPLVKTVILSDGKELDLEIVLETDRDVFAKDLRKVLEDEET